MKQKSIALFIVLIFVLVATTQCSPAVSTTTSSSSSSSTLDGKTLVENQCSVCHNLDRIQNAHKDANAWKTTVERMVGKGAKLSTDEQALVIDYLTKTYP